MNQERISACLSPIFAGTVNKTSGTHPVTLSLPKSLRKHNRLSPRNFVEPSTHKRRPKPLEAAKRALKDLYYHPYSLPIGKIFYNKDKVNKSGSYHQMRSERRENISSRVGAFLFHYLNLETMMIGWIADNNFIHPGIEFICKKLGASYREVKAALQVYVKNGYLEITERKHLQPNGTYRSDTATIKVNPMFFHDLDISDDYICAEYQKYVENEKRIEENKRKHAEIEQKKKEYIETIKQNKVKAKQQKQGYIKSVQKLYMDYKDGLALTVEEMDRLRKEHPGIDRIRQSNTPAYIDYTGCSAAQMRAPAEQKPSAVGEHYMAQILRNLHISKKPPS